jgi:hypothetical protein
MSPQEEYMASPLRRIDPNTRSVIVKDLSDPYVKFEYSGGNLVYMGQHYEHGAATSADDWTVFKFTITSDGITQIEELTGAWDDRATLAWS